jgi:6-pyruvoyltetrahydropterin/6-carboxytetrahydropterin synthase
MFSIRVEAEFAAAHFLSHYQGKCEHLHGHNYRVRVWARGEQLDEGGMLADFGLLKTALKEVIKTLDHTSLNDNPVFKDDPSAERIAYYIFTAIAEKVSALGIDPALISAVDVYETSTNMARYEADNAAAASGK